MNAAISLHAQFRYDFSQRTQNYVPLTSSSEKLYFTGLQPTATYVIYNGSGQKVMEGQCNESGITLNDLTTGVYQIVVAENSKLRRGSFIKQ